MADKVLEITTDCLNVVIRSKKNIAVQRQDSSARCSKLNVSGWNINRIRVPSQDIEIVNDSLLGYTINEINVSPLFYEQTDYELVVKSKDGESVKVWHENYYVRDRLGYITDDDQTIITGIINFSNNVGFSDFEIENGQQKVLVIRIEVYPSKISYKEDYCAMMEDINEMAYGAVIDFMKSTYKTFSVGDKVIDIPAVFFRLITALFEDFIIACNRIIKVPHHKLVEEHRVESAYKVKRIDNRSQKWLLSHQGSVLKKDGKIIVDKMLAVRKLITYDTAENQFVKFILRSTLKRLKNFVRRYTRSGKYETSVVGTAESMIGALNRFLSTTFLKDVSEYNRNQSLSLVFGMAPGYRELYKYYLMLQKGLSMNGDVFRMSMKDTAQLYEYWCFIKLFTILKKNYILDSDDIIKVTNNGVVINLVKGTNSIAKFINPETGEHIKLCYNQSERETQTVNQKPDNVLQLEKIGADANYQYVFDAKYKIETETSGGFYPDSQPGPKVEDINTMHRYRDAIVYENPQSRFTFEKTMFGAYILFPYGDEEKYANFESVENGNVVQGHKFYRSINSVNIGGLPFLPSATNLVEKMLDELIFDSSDSAFERASMPAGIESKLKKIDWKNRDVLVGSFNSLEAFDICLNEKYYYIPKDSIKKEKLPVRYIALYQTKNLFFENACIKFYGEVLYTDLVKRSEISVPIKQDNPDELYYRFVIREWKTLENVIKPKESGFFDTTTLFLLENSEFVPELSITSEMGFRMNYELKRAVKKVEIDNHISPVHFNIGDINVNLIDKEIRVYKDNNRIAHYSIDQFSRMPGAIFRMMMKDIENFDRKVSDLIE